MLHEIPAQMPPPFPAAAACTSHRTFWPGYKRCILADKALPQTAHQEEGHCPRAPAPTYINEIQCRPAAAPSWTAEEVYPGAASDRLWLWAAVSSQHPLSLDAGLYQKCHWQRSAEWYDQVAYQVAYRALRPLIPVQLLRWVRRRRVQASLYLR